MEHAGFADVEARSVTEVDTTGRTGRELDKAESSRPPRSHLASSRHCQSAGRLSCHCLNNRSPYREPSWSGSVRHLPMHWLFLRAEEPCWQQGLASESLLVPSFKTNQICCDIKSLTGRRFPVCHYYQRSCNRCADEINFINTPFSLSMGHCVIEVLATLTIAVARLTRIVIHLMTRQRRS